MDYEQKYKDALERAKNLIALYPQDAPGYREVFPELAESEDERIRKALIEVFKKKLERGFEWVEYGIPNRSVLAWLEKQKEQKPAESISQPTVQGKGVYKICPRCKERMVRDDSMVYTSMPPQYRYECPKCGESECDTVMYDNPEMEKQKPAEVDESTKRLNDNWMKQHFDDYKERKPAEWSEEDEERLELVIDCLYEYYPDPVMKYKLKDWIKSLPKRFNLQPKQEWSEEDEACIRNLESIIYYDKKLPNDTRVILGKFLSNLRPQPKRDCKDCAMFLNGKCTKPHWKPSEVCYGPKGDPDPAGVWKPSEEQMEALRRVVNKLANTDVADSVRLSIMYDNLKKL